MKIVRTSSLKKAVIAAAVCCAVVGLAAHGYAEEGEGAAHAAAQMKDFAWRWLNFAVLAAIIVWALKKANVAGSLRDRRATIEKMLKEAVEAKEAADKKFREYSDKLTQANREIEELSAVMKREGELEKERIIAEATKHAAKIREQAEAAAVQEVLKAKIELREEAARLAVELAEKKISDNIVKNDQDALVGDYISKVVKLH